MKPIELDESLVAQLAELASSIDGGRKDEMQEAVQTFNKMSGSQLVFSDFQGIYGAEEHDEFVRRLLLQNQAKASPELSIDELTQLFQDVLDNPSNEQRVSQVIALIKKTWPDSNPSDLIFWPGEYFGDGNNRRELSARQMAQEILEPGSTVL